MKLLTQSAFAKQIGITRQAISKAIKNEMLPVVIENGKKYINPVDPIVKEYAENIKSVREDKQKSTKPKKPVKVKGNKKAGKPDPVEEVEKNIPDYLKKISDSGQLTYAQIKDMSKLDMDKIKIYEEIKQKRIKTAKDKNELISRKLVRIVLGKYYQIDTNEILTLKNKVVPDIASIMGCTEPEKMLEAEKRIDEELWKILKHIKKVRDDFIKKIGGEIITDEEN